MSCQGKPLALRRALRNLIDNATNYGHKAEVRVLVESGIAVVSVCDEGPGIPPEDMERVTAPFVRLESLVAPPVALAWDSPSRPPLRRRMAVSCV